MTKVFKKFVYRAAKSTGMFLISRKSTRNSLRILAYHGLAMADEGRFRPQLFMNPEEFRNRMEYIVAKKYPVLSLDEALAGLRNRNLPDGATVITFDDGWYSTWKVAVPILRELSLPATIYVTTYYCIKEHPVFRLVVQYMFWKTACQRLDFSGLGLPMTGSIPLDNRGARLEIAEDIIQHGETAMSEEERAELCHALGERLNIDYDEMHRQRLLSLMTASEVRKASLSGIDIQLHTHRHFVPEPAEGIRREIDDNRRALEPLTIKRPIHFCYPSGVVYDSHAPTLASLGVASGVTCSSGLNCYGTPSLALSRFLDGSNIAFIEFEAEMSGFSELLRRLRGKLEGGWNAVRNSRGPF